MTKEIICLRPHVGEDILADSEEFHVDGVALSAGEAVVLVKATHGSGRKLTKRRLAGMGFFAD